MIYLVIIVSLMILACRYDFRDYTINKQFWFNIVLAALILLAGFRYRMGADSINYTYSFYYDTPYLWELKSDDFSSGFEPLFFLMNSFVKSIGGKFYFVQLLEALFVNILVVNYIKKHSRYVFSCILLYFLWIYPYYMTEEMRASMAVALCLYANDYILEKNWVKGISLILISVFFHYSAIVLLLTPLFVYLRFNVLGYITLFLSLFLGFKIQQVFGDYILLLGVGGAVGEKAEAYANNDLLFEYRITLIGIITTKVVYIIYSIIAFYYIKLKSLQNDRNLLQMQPFVMTGLIFVLFSIPMPISYRYVHFYEVYFLFFFVHLFVDLVKDNKMHSVAVSLVKCFVLSVPLLYGLSYEVYRANYSSSNWSHPVYGYTRFYPYASIFDKTIDEEREFFYRSWEIGMIVPKDKY